jgi:hypothetical protein
MMGACSLGFVERAIAQKPRPAMNMNPHGKSRKKAIAFAPLLALLPLILGVARPLQAGNNERSEAFWWNRIRKVHLNMRQHRVLELLPNRSKETQEFDKKGGSYTLTYALNKRWSVAISFNRSGWREENNPYSVMGFPNDKVIRPPRLVRQENLIDETLFPATPPKPR